MTANGQLPTAHGGVGSEIFWDVDTQVDFMLPEGKLYAPGAERTIPNLERLTRYARQCRILVVASMDAHQPGDAEFAEWPPHCIAGTPGQQKIEQTQLRSRLVLPNAAVEVPRDLSQFEQIILEKQSVDVFTNPNVEALLRHMGKPVVTLFGVVTEVCVFLGTRDLLARGYRVRVVTDAIAAFRPEEGNNALAEMKRRGAQFATTDEVCT